MEELKEKTAKGLFWGGVSNVFQQILGLLFGIFLARILSVEDYGVVGMVAIFTGIGNSIQEAGFTSALTNRKNITHTDYNSVFWFNIILGIILYSFLFFSAPLIAKFYGNPNLTGVSRIAFLSILFGCFGTVQSAYLFKNLKVKEQAKINIVSLFTASIVSLILAILGYGYWGLAIQLAVHMGVMTLLKWFYSDWRPTLTFDILPLKEMFPFSIKIMITGIFNQISANIFAVITGKSYGETETGYFTQGNKWMNMGKGITAGMINSVAQPIFTQVQEDEKRKINILRKLVRFTAFISFPAMLGLALIGPELIPIMIGDKWIPSIPILQMLCIWGAFFPFTEIYKNVIFSSGDSGVYMRINIIFGILQIIVLILTIPFGLYWLAACYVGTYFIYLFIWHIETARILPIRWQDILKDIAPYLGVTLLIVGISFLFSLLVKNSYLKITIKIVTFVFLYITCMWKSQSVIFRESLEFIKKSFHRFFK